MMPHVLTTGAILSTDANSPLHMRGDPLVTGYPQLFNSFKDYLIYLLDTLLSLNYSYLQYKIWHKPLQAFW